MTDKKWVRILIVIMLGVICYLHAIAPLASGSISSNYSSIVGLVLQSKFLAITVNFWLALVGTEAVPISIYIRYCVYDKSINY